MSLELVWLTKVALLSVVFHAALDQVIPEEPLRQYVEAQCAAGSIIEYSRSISEHATEVSQLCSSNPCLLLADTPLIQTYISIPKVFNWIVAAFDHKLNATGCTRTTHSIANFLDPLFQLNAGPKAAAQARASLDTNLFKLI